MKREEIEWRVETLVTPYCEDNGFELVDVEYVKEGSDYILRVFADKDGGITIDDCVEISRFLDPILEQEDYIEGEYRLQVSSPGLDRTLKKEKDFVRYSGREVEYKTFEKVNGTKEHEGVLKGYKDGVISVEEDSNLIELKESDIALMKLKVIF